MVGVAAVPHPFASPDLGGKTCSLVRETTKISDECFLEPECGQECETVNEKKCQTKQEQKCRTIEEQVCDNIGVSQIQSSRFNLVFV